MISKLLSVLLLKISPYADQSWRMQLNFSTSVCFSLISLHQGDIWARTPRCFLCIFKGWPCFHVAINLYIKKKSYIKDPYRDLNQNKDPLPPC